MAREKISKNIAIILCNYLTACLETCISSRNSARAVSTKNRARVTIVNRVRDLTFPESNVDGALRDS